MVICKYCGQEMLAHTSCYPKVKIQGKIYDRIKFGDEPNNVNHIMKCKDCGCYIGMYHHFECDVEKDPIYGEQMLLLILGDKTIKPVKE